MRENRIRTLWREDKAVVNGWLAIPSTFSAETMAHQGWDSLTVDMQHGVVDYQMAVNMLTAVSTTNTVPMVRVPWLDPGIIMKSLDAGAYAVICPMINTRAEAEKLVSYVRYAPRGVRSFGPIRAFLYGGADYPTHANDTVIPFAMIETTLLWRCLMLSMTPLKCSSSSAPSGRGSSMSWRTDSMYISLTTPTEGISDKP